MKKLIQFLIFITYTILTFYLKKLLIVIMLINLISMYVLKINLKKAISNIIGISFIIILTAVINSLIINIETGLLIGIRLALVCNTTYIFSQKFSYTDLAKVIEKIFFFMKIFGINPKDIGLMVCIAIAFVPILKHEMNGIKNSLKSKNFKLKATNMKYILQPFFISIFKKVGQIEEALIAKGYDSLSEN